MLTPHARESLLDRLLAWGNFETIDGAPAARRRAAERFIDESGPDDPPPVWWFDPIFYLQQRSGSASHPNPYLDFLARGRREGAYPSLTVMEADAEILAVSPGFDADFYAAASGAAGSRQALALHALGDPRALPKPGFDRGFFELSHPEAFDRAPSPLVFYAENHDRAWFYGDRTLAVRDAELLLNSDLFDEAYYRGHHLGFGAPVSSRLHYLTCGARLGFDPGPRFSTRGYENAVTAVKASGLNPLVHLRTTGRAPPQISNTLHAAQRAWEADRPTIVIVVHRFDRTGAPIVGLQLVEQLSATHNIVVWTGEDGELGPVFAMYACDLLVNAPKISDASLIAAHIASRYSPLFAVCNSAATGFAVRAFSERGVPVVSLVHEFAGYTRPMGRLTATLARSDRVVFPAEVVRQAALAECVAVGVPAPTHCIIRPQGAYEMAAAPEGETRAAVLRAVLGRDHAGPVVLGAGFVQPRKGVDLFVDVARRAVQDFGSDAIFLWVGGNFSPTDPRSGFWIQDQIERSGVADRVVMAPQMPSLEPVYRAANAFLLTSRLDPYPNVVLDAVQYSLPVVCFHGATGSAELGDDTATDVHAVRYLDTEAAARTLVALLERGRRLRSGAETAAVSLRLDRASYAQAILREGELAAEAAQTAAAAAAGLTEFDAAHFLASTPSPLRPLLLGAPPEAMRRFYAGLGAKGMPFGSPRAGVWTRRGGDLAFHDVVGLQKGVVPPGHEGAVVAAHFFGSEPWLLRQAERARGAGIDTFTLSLRHAPNADMNDLNQALGRLRLVCPSAALSEAVSPLAALLDEASSAGPATLVCLLSDACEDLTGDQDPAEILLGGRWAVRQIIQAFRNQPTLGMIVAEPWAPDDEETAPTPYLGAAPYRRQPMVWARGAVLQAARMRAADRGTAGGRDLVGACDALGLGWRGALLVHPGAQGASVP